MRREEAESLSYTARAPGSWGELVQGSVDGEDVLITCAVSLYAAARARPRSDERTIRSGQGWRVAPGHRRTQTILDGLPGSGQVEVRSSLRRGAGMGSSTADLCAALSAAAALMDIAVSPISLFRRCLALEPTDGLMFPGIAVVDHRRGRQARSLGPAPPLAILGVDPGGMVATSSFNAQPDLAAGNRRKEPQIREALSLAIHAVDAGDPVELAAAATLSARAHQAILPNPLWKKAAQLAPACGAIGLNVAHSGTVLGLLFDSRQTDLPAVRIWLESRLGLDVRCMVLSGGGVKVYRDRYRSVNH